MPPSLAKSGSANLPLAFGLALAAGIVIERGLKNFTGGFSGATSGSGGGGGGTSKPVGSKVNPLPGWTPSVTDQGVDFSGGKKIFAPMAGTVLKVGAPGWPMGHPGTNGVLLRLVDGSVVYFYEGLTAAVKVGQHVNPGELIARGISGQSIEVGLAQPSGTTLGSSWASAHGDPHTPLSSHGGNPWGQKARAFLKGLGVPGL